MLFDNLHEMARRAVDRMRNMAEGAGGDLTDFHERQLVHALFQELEQSNSCLWAAFEYRYFRETERQWLLGRADICAWADDVRGWFEVKSTGLNPDGWDNSHYGIWQYDVDKLDQVRGQSNTQAGWVWLFLFETYRREIAQWGTGKEWSAAKTAGEAAPLLGRIDTQVGRLSRSLNAVDEFAKLNQTSAVVSILPQLQRASCNVWEDRQEYSALLLTMDLSKNMPS